MRLHIVPVVVAVTDGDARDSDRQQITVTQLTGGGVKDDEIY